MREMVKVSMETRVSRGTYQDKTHWIEEPALCPCILTSNPPFSDELGFRSRLIYNVYTKEDKFWDANQKKEFMAFLTQGRKHLSVLGHFAAGYILNNQDVLLKKNIEDCDWKASAEDVLKAFYQSAGLEIPDWITLWVDESDVIESAAQEASETTRFELLGLFVNAIHDGYRKDPIIETDAEGRRIYNDVNLQRKFDRCLTQRLVTYLFNHMGRDKKSQVIITHEVMKEIKRNKITNVGTMQALANELPGFEYGPLFHDSKTIRVVHGPYDDFLKFLNFSADDEVEEKEKAAEAGN